MPAASRPSARPRSRRLALALGQARLQLKDNRAQLLAIVEDIAPGLTSRYGVGPVSAAQAIVSFSHPGRCRSEAAFAALGGTSPIPASSGQTVRHRLNRGGDRALNRAIHAIALTRMRSCPRTRAYVARRTAEGKTRTRDPPLPQAVHRPRALPAAQPVDETPHESLTNIEASEGWGFEYLRARVRRPRRHQPHPGQQRKDDPAPAQPRRRPVPQPRQLRHRHLPDSQLPPHPRLRRPAHRGGKDRPRNPPLPQAIHRPRALPSAHPLDETAHEPLTNIEASEGWGSNPSERAHMISQEIPDSPEPLLGSGCFPFGPGGRPVGW